jgi:hypothetical protein
LGSSLEGNDLSILKKFVEKLAEVGVSIDKGIRKVDYHANILETVDDHAAVVAPERNLERRLR